MSLTTLVFFIRMARKFYLSLFFFGVLLSGVAHSQAIEIKLHQIKELSEQYSPQWQQFDNRLNYSVRGEQASATRINPSIAYDLEFLDDGTQSEFEHYLYLQKEFRLPGHHRNLRERRDSRITQHEYEAESSRAEWMAQTRLGFIRILLNQQEIEQLGILKDQVDRLSEASFRRAEEGESAAIDDQLLQMSRYHLEARINEKYLETNRLITYWKSRMGFGRDTEVRFAGNINEDRVNLPQTAELISILDESPRARAERQAIQSASLETSFAQSNRIPSVELSAGYKQLNPNWNGFLVGIALPLPLLSSNREAISQAKALEQIEQTERNLAQMERNQVAFQILNALVDYEVKLGQTPEHLSQPEPFLNRLLISYQEGSMSINDFLNSLNLMADAYQTKFSRLFGYYSMILELEAMAGREFINP
jgi:outer membrane protein TolC